MRLFALALLFLGLSVHAWGATSDPVATTSGLCSAAITAAEKTQQTPPNLLGTMAKVESGRPIPSTGQTGPWPWTIDSDGQAYFFNTKQEAVDWTKAALARGVHYLDAGCLQVDLPQHPNAFRSVEDAFDPTLNAAYAARFLRQLYDGDAGHSWPLAVGYYHSHTPELAEEYRSKVASVGADILAGVAGTASPLYYRALTAGTLHLPLVGGGSLVLHIREPGMIHRHMSACKAAAILGDYLRSPPKQCRTTASR